MNTIWNYWTCQEFLSVMIYHNGFHPLVFFTGNHDHVKSAVTAFILLRFSRRFRMKCPMLPKWTFGLMDPQVNSKINICLQVSGDYRLNFQNVSWIGISLLPLMARIKWCIRWMVQRRVLTRQNIVSDAESFPRSLVEAGSKTDVIGNRVQK